MFELLSLWSGHGMGMVGSAIPTKGQRPNGRMEWGCESSDFADGASYTSCRPPDAASVHRERHLTYPQLMPGGFWRDGRAYDGERSNALPLVRGALEPWVTNQPVDMPFQHMMFN